MVAFFQTNPIYSLKKGLKTAADTYVTLKHMTTSLSFMAFEHSLLTIFAFFLTPWLLLQSVTRKRPRMVLARDTNGFVANHCEE